MADLERAENNEGNEADAEDVESSDSDGRFGADIFHYIATKSGKCYMRSQNVTLAHVCPQIRRRLQALRKLQYECTLLEADFYKEVHALECKYGNLYLPFYEKRAAILSGDYEPTDEECNFPDHDIYSGVPENLVPESAGDHEDEYKGIPEFWLSVFKNVDMLADMIQGHDEPILEKLADVTVKLNKSDPMGFILEFHFEPNEYFSNSVLTKEYEMKCVVPDNEPFTFEGPEIYKCKGCVIKWKSGRNVTLKTIQKRQKHKQKGTIRTVTRTVQNTSFFNFFSPPSLSSENENMDEETRIALSADFEIGHFIRERLIPRAALYYTGEAIDLTDDEDAEEEDDLEEEDLEEEEEYED